jgi:hypothetical protein
VLPIISRIWNRIRSFGRNNDFNALVEHHRRHGNYDLPSDETPEVIDVEYTVVKESPAGTAIDDLGIVLARCWIDQNLVAKMEADPQTALDDLGVVLPKGMSIEFAKTEKNRPSVILYERTGFMRKRNRVCAFQLTMTAIK